MGEGGLLAPDEIFDLGQELGGIAEAAVDGGKAEKGDLIELFELIHYFAANHSRGDFALIFGIDFLNNAIDQQFNLGFGNGALDGGMLHRSLEFLAVEVFMPAIPFQYAEGGFHHFFIGGEPMAALGTDPATANDFAIPNGTGINNFIVRLSTFGATHRRSVRRGGREVKRGGADSRMHVDACFFGAGCGICCA